MKPMSDREYVSNGGSKCPVCHSEEIEGVANTDMDGDWISKGVVCKNCNSTWDDIFTLSGYDNLKFWLEELNEE